MSDNEQARQSGRDVGRYLASAMEKHFRHSRMAAHWIAIVDFFSSAPGYAPLQLQLSRNDRLGKISLADKDRDNIDFDAFDHAQYLAHGRLFLPKAAMDLAKDAARPQ
jgi:hypothetical protein